MSFATSPRLQTTGREEREARLRDFVAAALVVRRALGDREPASISLVARAPDSPIARVLADMAGELTAANIGVTIVLLDLDTYTDEPGRPSVLDMSSANVRVLTDPRFTSAHEQLVLGHTIIWLGDCMRRDPAKRDAFELFHHDNAEAAKHASISFERLWASAQDVRRVRPIAPEVMVAGSFGEAGASQAQPLTRR
ncbi:MAG TPA: hypothetical protein PKD49_04160 [Hyphomicrobium sp.]|nr:hypothetical protein [Hyphomicrobium sp.]